MRRHPEDVHACVGIMVRSTSIFFKSIRLLVFCAFTQTFLDAVYFYSIFFQPFLEASEMVPEYRRLRFLLRWFWPVLYVLATVAEVAGRLLPLSWRRAMMAGHTNAMDPAVADYTVCVRLRGVICLWRTHA